MNIPEIAIILGTLIIAYLLGAIPTAYIMCKKIANVDIREQGSGNVGAVNTRRVLGTKYAIVVLVIDILKGVLAVLLALYVQQSFNIMTHWAVLPALNAFIVVFGHTKSIFINFTGGKGAATGAGTLLSLHWPTGIIIILLTLLSSKLTKFRSLGIYIAVPLAAVSMWLFNQPVSYS
ncbi:MAG: glycerol-3-phosphate acyltransferase, partial [Vampirovibrionia bacterium]